MSNDHASLFPDLLECIQLNNAVFQLFYQAASGDVDDAHLAEMTNKAIELTTQLEPRLQAFMSDVPDELFKDAARSKAHGFTTSKLIDSAILLHRANKKRKGKS